MTAYDFSHKSSNLMPNYLNNHVQGLNVNNTLSSRKKIIAGVPRSSIVTHLFFKIYINDISLFKKEAFFEQLYTYQTKP